LELGLDLSFGNKEESWGVSGPDFLIRVRQTKVQCDMIL